MDFEITRKVLAALEREQVNYTVFGGVALNFLGLARATQDLDLFIAPDSENIDRLKRALHSVFEDPNIDDIRADELLGDYPAVQYVPPEGSFHLDILTRLGSAFSFYDLNSFRLDVDGLTVTVVTPQTLYRMKRDTVRPRDRDDAQALRRRFHLSEE